MAKLWWALTQPAGGQAEDHRAFQAPLAVKIDVLDDRSGAQFGRAQITAHPAVLAFGESLVDQQPEAFLEAQGLVSGLVALFGQAGGHGRQFQGVKPVDGLVVEHFVVPFFSCSRSGPRRLSWAGWVRLSGSCTGWRSKPWRNMDSTER